MKNSEEFKRFCKLGYSPSLTPLDEFDVSREMGHMVQQLIEMLSLSSNAKAAALPKIAPLHIGVYLDHRVNAIAGRWEGASYVALSYGLVVATSNMMIVALSHCRPLLEPDLTNRPDALVVDEAELLAVLYNKGELLIERLATGAMPIQLALTYLLLHFVVSHELVHLRNGHVDYIQQRGAARPMIAEGPFQDEQAIETARWHALEYDADRNSVRSYLRVGIDCIAGIKAQKEADVQNAIRALVTALVLLFRMLGCIESGVASDRRKHPAAALRLAMVLDMVGPILHASKVRQASALIRAGITDGLILWGMLSSSHVVSGADIAAARTSTEEVAIKSAWQALMIELEPYNRGRFPLLNTSPEFQSI